MKKNVFKIIFIFVIAFFCINVSALKSTSNDLVNRNVCPNYEVATANGDGSITSVSCYDSYSDAKVFMDESTDDSLIILGKYDDKTHIINAKYALVYLDHGDINQDIYCSSSLKTAITYMNNSSSYGGTDGVLLDVNISNYAAKIKIAGVTGWIKKSESKYIDYYIIPLNWVKTSSYYKITNDKISHYYAKNIENDGYTQSNRTLGPKPSMLEVGTYYSYDGNYFYSDLKSMIDDYKKDSHELSVNKDNVYYNYYMYLPHRSRTNYTIDDLDTYIRNVLGFKGSIYGRKSVSNHSVLYGTSEYYMKAEEMYGANAISVFGLSMNESAKGRSNIAINKNNVFGHSAYDGTAYDSATGYLDVGRSIYSHSYSYINYGYSEVADSRYYGGHFGNKLTGMNVKYASDIYWGEKAANYYYEFDQDNGMLDYNYYQIVISNGTKINARSAPNTNSKVPYVIPYKGIPFILIEEVTGEEIKGSTVWYKLQSDSNITSSGSIIGSNSTIMPEYNWDGYIYVHSSYFIKANEGKVDSNGKYNSPASTKKEKIDDYDYNVYATKTSYTPKVGLLTNDTDYYHSSTLLNKKGTLKKDSYVTILMEAKNGDDVNYLVITNYSTYQRHWISGKNVKIIDKDLLKVSISESGKYISLLNSPNGSEIFKVYTDNQLVIVDKEIYNEKLYLKVMYQNEGSILYGYVDSTISNISYTLNYLNSIPEIKTDDLTLFLNEEYNLLDYVTGYDLEDGDITKNIKITENNINNKKVGTYSVTYSLTDSYGDTVYKKINVYVIQQEYSDALFMYHNFEYIASDAFNISGFLGIKGKDNKIVIHGLSFENQVTGEMYEFILDNWEDYPYEMSSLDDDKAYDYSGGWFNSDIDLSSLPNGDYNVYITAITDKYVTATYFTNIAYMNMTRRAVGSKHSYSIEVDYSTLNSPLVFSVRDKLLSETIPNTFDPMYNFFNDIKLDGSKLTIKGTSHNVGVSFSVNDNVQRKLVFENNKTFERFSFDIDSITNGDYPITLAVSDNCDKTRAWYNKTIDISSIPKGDYAIYIVNNVNNKAYHGELIDIMYTDFTSINTNKYQFSRNDDQRLRLELSVKE